MLLLLGGGLCHFFASLAVSPAVGSVDAAVSTAHRSHWQPAVQHLQQLEAAQLGHQLRLEVVL